LKKIFFLASVILVGSCILQIGFVFSGPPAKTDKVIAYYFHGVFRCSTCHKLEEYSKEAIEANFKDELNSDKLEFITVNIEHRENKHFVSDYQLYTKSLILSLVKDGKEIKSKNLTKIWEYVGDKQKFIDYVRDEISVFLKEL
jgi:DNA-directed RNA polymerase subunit M/transcription elongation factor TFIIS